MDSSHIIDRICTRGKIQCSVLAVRVGDALNTGDDIHVVMVGIV